MRTTGVALHTLEIVVSLALKAEVCSFGAPALSV